MACPPSPYAYRLSVILAQGDYHRAAHLLESLNRIQRAFGFPDYDMPEPHGPMDGLVTCSADPAHDALLDLTVQSLGGGAYRVAA